MIVLSNSDCRGLARSLPAESFDLIFADPPWGGTAHPWDRHVDGWVKPMVRLLKPNGSLWMLTNMKHMLRIMPEFNDWRLVQDIVNEQSNGDGPTIRPLFREVHSLGVHFRPPGSRLGDLSLHSPRDPEKGLIQRSVMLAYVPKRKYHPHQQPLDLVKAVIQSACPVGGRVFEPFAGSATGAIACHEMGMDCISAEIDFDNFEIAEKRLRDLGIYHTTSADGHAFTAFFGEHTDAHPSPQRPRTDREAERRTVATGIAVPVDHPLQRRVRVQCGPRRKPVPRQ